MRISLAAAGPLAVLAASFAVWAGLSPRQSGDPGEAVLISFTPREVRVLKTVETAAFFYSPLETDGEVRLEGLRVEAGGYAIHEAPLALSLRPDPRFGEVSALVERLPHNHRGGGEERHYADPADPEFQGAEVIEVRREVAERLRALEEEYDGGRGRPYVQLDFPLHLDQVFTPDEPAGTRREVRVELRWRGPDGALRTTSSTRAVMRLPAPLGVPPSFQALGAGTSVHAGDLHVHSCHGEASGACAPSSNCTAETLQTSGSFSYAQLRSQYEALGMDWFTATDHSYCIDSDGEYDVVVAECAALTDATFLCLPDIELSSDEEGPQVGGDSGDLACLGTTSANHMGAHQLTARTPGGEEGFLGFCDGLFGDALEPFTDNLASIRAQGGYPIAHHPTSGNFGWNSYDAATGIEAGGLHGVEIWNGASQSGQGGDVGRWVDWMLDGRLLYAYSGSDTHDEAFAFGANHVLLGPGEFDAAGLHAALRAGRSYVSNGHALILDVELGGATLAMGAMHPLPPGSPAAATNVRVHYDFGGDNATITVFAGRAGDASESVLCTSGPLSGQGVFECASNLETSATSWVRAYSEAGSSTAYTNPVFFLPSTEDPGTYCTPKTNSAGCGATVASSGAASATNPAPFLITAQDVLNQKNGILFYGLAPAFNPFDGGTLCVAPPQRRTPPQGSGGNAGPPDCSGSFSFDFNARIQSGIDASLVAGEEVYAQYWHRDPGVASGTGLTNAIWFSIGP